jgi:hypothetical protein
MMSLARQVVTCNYMLYFLLPLALPSEHRAAVR